MAFLCHGKNVLKVLVNLFLMRFFVMRNVGGFFAPPWYLTGVPKHSITFYFFDDVRMEKH